MQYVQFYACDPGGVIAPGASVSVHPMASAELAPLFGLAGEPISNPIIAGADALYGFAAADGDYDLVVTVGLQAGPAQRVYLYDPAGGGGRGGAGGASGSGSEVSPGGGIDGDVGRMFGAYDRQIADAEATIAGLLSAANEAADAAIAAALAKFGTDGDDLNAVAIAQLALQMRALDESIAAIFAGLPPGGYIKEIATTTQTSAETLGIIGTVSPDGLSFVFNDSACSYSDGATLASFRAGVVAQVAGAFAAVNVEQTARIQGQTALSTSISTVQVQVGQNSSAIYNETQARVSADSAEAQQRVALAAVVAGNSSTINQNFIALTTADSTEATARLALDSRFQSYQSSASQQFLTLTNSTQSLAAQLTNLNSDYAGFKSSASQQLVTLSNNDMSFSSQLTNLSSDYGSFKSSANTQLASLSTSSASLSTSLTNLTASYNGFSANASQQISTLQTNVSSVALSVTNLSSQLGNVSASLSVTAATLTNLQSQVGTAYFSIVAQASGGNPTYFKLASSSGGGAAALVSDRILLGNPDGSGVQTALQVSGGNVYIPNILFLGQSSRVHIDGSTGTFRVYDPNGTLRVRMGLW